MNRRNYQRELDNIIKRNTEANRVPSLLLHCCCAPCSSYVLEYLTQYFQITVFFYNPNIYPVSEYAHRVEEIKRLVREMPLPNPVEVIEGRFDPNEFYCLTKGHEKDEEGGARCTLCFNLRLTETAKLAKELCFDYFTTTLTVGPRKNSDRLNEIGDSIAEQYGVAYLTSDFKRRCGFERSKELSRTYHLYRQNYCGCVFSKNQTQDGGGKNEPDIPK